MEINNLKRKYKCLCAQQDLLNNPIKRLKSLCIDYDHTSDILDHSRKYYSPELSANISKIHTNYDSRFIEIDRDISVYIELDKEINAVSREIKIREDANALLNATIQTSINIDTIMNKVNALAKYPCIYNVRNEVLDVHFASLPFPDKIYDEYDNIIARRCAIVQRSSLYYNKNDMAILKTIALLKRLQIQYMTDCVQAFNRNIIKDLKWIGITRINFNFFDDQHVLQYIFNKAAQINYKINYIFPAILKPQTSESVALSNYLKLISNIMRVDQDSMAINLLL